MHKRGWMIDYLKTYGNWPPKKIWFLIWHLFSNMTDRSRVESTNSWNVFFLWQHSLVVNSFQRKKVHVNHQCGNQTVKVTCLSWTGLEISKRCQWTGPSQNEMLLALPCKATPYAQQWLVQADNWHGSISHSSPFLRWLTYYNHTFVYILDPLSRAWYKEARYFWRGEGTPPCME